MSSFCTELEVSSLLMSVASAIDIRPVIFVAKREITKQNRMTYTATFAMQTVANNESLVHALIKLSIENEDIVFAGSDLDIQGGNLTIDFMWVNAVIRRNLAT